MKTKTRFHKLTAWLLTVAMLMAFIPSFTLGVSAEAITSGTSGTISYTLDSDGVLTISGTGKIPDSFYDKINSSNRPLVKRIVIEEGITGTGKNSLTAFTLVTSVSMPSTLSSIGSYTFNGCYKLKTITYWGTSGFTATNILNSSVTPAIYVKTNYSNTKMFGKSVTKILTETSKECTVKFDMNGYGTQVDSQYVFNIEGYNKVTKPTDPSAPEVKFEGWYKDSALTTAWNFDTDTVSDNTTIYAKWNTTPDHTVSFYMGSYGTAIANRGIVSGTLIAEPETPIDNNGIFLGWYKESTFDNLWNFDTDTVTADTTLYAKWRAVDGTRPAKGDGSESAPFEIGTADELYWFADYYNNSTALSEAHAILTADITVNQNVLKADGTLNGDGSTFRAWQPIGTSAKKYVGTFDGQGYTISGLYFNNTDSVVGTNIGLFGYLGDGATIKRIEIDDTYFKGYQYVSSIAGRGRAATVIENCKSSVTLEASADISYLSGISIYSLIENCLFVGKASGGSQYVGSICATGRSDNTNNYYLKGCAVNSNGVVQSGCGSSKDTPSTDGDNNYTGVTLEQLASGEIAYKLQKGQEDSSIQVWGQKIDGESKDEYPMLSSDRVYLAGTADEPYFTNNDEGVEDFTKPTLVDASNYSLLGLSSEYIGYYAISDYVQLCSFKDIVNDGDYDANAVLLDNIIANENLLKDDGTLNGDGTDLNVWNPILPGDSTENTLYVSKYLGTFDGNNKYISGLYYNNSVGAVRGLFGYIGESGIVKDLGIVDSYFYGQRRVGAIAGSNAGTITNCYNESTIKSYPKSSAGMNDSVDFGGIAGYNSGKIENCYNKGYISAYKDSLNNATSAGGIAGSSSGVINKCYNEGKIEAYASVGGIVGGLSNSTISNSYNVGTVSSLSTSSGSMANAGGIAGNAIASDHSPLIEKCWNSGTVNAVKGFYVGGIVGYQKGQYLTVKNCYNVGKVDAENSKSVGGIIGYAVRDAVIGTSYNHAEVIGSTYVGGVVGRIGTVSGTVTDNDITITNCYYLEGCAVDSNDTAQNGVGNETAGSTTEDVSGEATALTVEQMTDDADWKTNYTGFDTTTVWSKDTNTAGAWYLPKLDNHSVSVEVPVKEFAITAFDADTKTATIIIPSAGTYTLIFADYDGDRLNDIDIVTVTVTSETIGEITKASEKGVTLGTGDKIMLWNNLSDYVPLCEVYIVK